MTNLKPVLYAEDDENDVFLMERTFKKLEIPNGLEITKDGKMAQAYLSRIAPYESREEPCLILLDLSMPGKHGLELLKWLKTTPALAHMPVIVFTSSNQKSDIHRSYELGAQGYVIKPGSPAELLRIIKNIKDYWLVDPRPPGNFLDYSKGIVIPPPKDSADSTLKNL